ncbi:MAG: adenylosuccinate lyase, partial [Anaerolineales bacterium]|nr:adenylosuccinate lyase [Anaerolineales bacterium]
MPFKRNPVNAEKIDSLARALAQMPRLAWDNAAHSLLERTLDDSANRRSLLPEAFLICDELLQTATRIVKGLQVDEAALARNLAIYGPFAATERVLMALVKAGADRQEMHEHLRQHTLNAWEVIKSGQPNPLVSLVTQETEFCRYLNPQELSALMDAGQYVGNAAVRARRLAGDIRSFINSPNNTK